MPIEILTVGLDDATIEKLADRVAARLSAQFVMNGSPEGYSPVTSSPEFQGAADAGTSQQQPDPWTNATPAAQYHQQPPQAPQNGPAQATGAGPVYDGGQQGYAPQQQPQGQPQGNQVPHCQHGEMKFVKAGYSQATGRSYPAFYACPTPRGFQGKCQSVTVQ